jgi:hypothetical protein
MMSLFLVLCITFQYSRIDGSGHVSSNNDGSDELGDRHVITARDVLYTATSSEHGNNLIT